MTTSIRAVRGATTVDADTPEQVTLRVQELLDAMIRRNDLCNDDMVSIVFTATSDVVSMFPAAAARTMGLGDVPLMCARELDVIGSTPRCIRVMMHVSTGRTRDQIHHVYLHDANGLRDDLPG
ncbi:MAG: chorismate mutase [Acidimicrobiales bacterium]|jgi:chorismate mutase